MLHSSIMVCSLACQWRRKFTWCPFTQSVLRMCFWKAALCDVTEGCDTSQMPLPGFRLLCLVLYDKLAEWLPERQDARQCWPVADFSTPLSYDYKLISNEKKLILTFEWLGFSRENSTHIHTLISSLHASVQNKQTKKHVETWRCWGFLPLSQTVCKESCCQNWIFKEPNVDDGRINSQTQIGPLTYASACVLHSAPLRGRCGTVNVGHVALRTKYRPVDKVFSAVALLWSHAKVCFSPTRLL